MIFNVFLFMLEFLFQIIYSRLKKIYISHKRLKILISHWLKMCFKKNNICK